MNTKCPNCGAVNSLDSLLANAESAELLRLLADLSDLGALALRYLGLFRPAKSQLSFARAAKLLAEIVPAIRAGEICRDGVVCPAPPEAWQHGFRAALEARDTCRLKLPLKSHGYLYEIISQWRPDKALPEPANRLQDKAAKPSQTLHAAAKLEELRR